MRGCRNTWSRPRAARAAACGAVLLIGLACSQAPPPATPGTRPVQPSEPLPETPPGEGPGEGRDEAGSAADGADRPGETSGGKNEEATTAAEAETTREGEGGSSEPPGDDADRGGAEDGANRDADEIQIERGTAIDRDDSVILIERGGASSPPTLYEAARKAREERGRTGASRITVNDENLHEFQGEGLTFAEPGADEEDPADGGGGETEESGEAEGGEGGKEAETGAEGAGGEEYWRSRLLDLRLRLREAVDELDELQERAGSLRRSFYAQDDPHVRDGRIKPAWDRVLDRIGETRRRIGELREELQQALEEGRRAGALPGWLREGIDVEPAPEELPEDMTEGEREPGRHRPEDPRVVEEEPEPPGHP